MDIDLNLTIAADGTVTCRHCPAVVGDSAAEPMKHAVHSERPSTAAGPGVHADPKLFTDRPIALRQRCCPGCFVLLATEIVPTDEKSYREWSLR